jgi:hypothetical protein
VYLAALGLARINQYVGAAFLTAMWTFWGVMAYRGVFATVFQRRLSEDYFHALRKLVRVSSTSSSVANRPSPEALSRRSMPANSSSMA